MLVFELRRKGGLSAQFSLALAGKMGKNVGTPSTRDKH
jgi:hypothetical protein